MNILITGTSRGIGNWLAKYYLEKGNRVYGCSRKLPENLHRVAGYEHKSLDVANEDAVVDYISSIEPIDILINNAGISAMNHSMIMPRDTASRIMNVNFFGTYTFSKHIARRMPEGGRIVNFTSISSPLNLEGEALYSVSKSAVETLTKIMARELDFKKITVNAVGPGPIKTDLIRGVPEKKMEDLIQRQAIKRYGTFEDVVNVIDFFIRPESNFITGQIIYLGGVS